MVSYYDCVVAIAAAKRRFTDHFINYQSVIANEGYHIMMIVFWLNLIAAAKRRLTNFDNISIHMNGFYNIHPVVV